MQIPSFPPAPVTSTSATKSQQTSAAQTAADAREALTASFKAVKVGGAVSAPVARSVPGIDGGLLSSMVETSLKMQEIRNDPNIPPMTKAKLLQPLEKANKDTLNIVNSKAEQEEREKIIEASSEDAQAIREAGEDIAESAREAEAEAAAAADSNEPTDTSATADRADVAPRESAAPQTSRPQAPAYSGPTASPAVGDSVDTHA